ncbi:hypothetical protein F0T03_06525 [Yersinia canariae]|uniref:Uncharacterized protein n=1 Tax=Yersinia canariae TaxID=2607663 RepID=A0A857EX61_9GAMM|nr:hypothetical protein [Yersinia canariae]QHB31850.1 hypothetical protein F0T03_06525 [Yersinia canariae]
MASVQGFEIISFDTFIAFLDAKGASLKCNLCEKEQLTIPQVSASCSMPVGMALGTYVNVFKENSIYGEVANRYYISLICKNCGHIMKIDAHTVLLWAKDYYISIQEGEKNVNS